MQRKFLTNLILLLFLNLLVKPFWLLGIDVEVQNIVGLEDYGFYFAILNFTFLFNIILDFGITNFNNRNIAQNNQLLNKHFSGIVILRLLLAVIYALVIFSAALIWWGPSFTHLYFLGFLAFNQFLLSSILYLRSNVSGLLHFRLDSFLSVLDRLLMILFCGLLIWNQTTRELFRIEWFVYAQTAAYLATAIIAALIVMKKARFRKLSWNWLFFLMILKQSLPFATLTFLMAIYNRVDAVLLARLLPEAQGETQAGIYAHAYRILDVFNQFAYLFAVLLLPLFAHMLKRKENIEKLVKLAFSMLFTVSVIVAFLSGFYSFQIMDLFYDEQIMASASAFGILMFGFIAISTTYIFGTLLTANGSLKQLNLVAFAGVLISLIINVILIPRLLATGSAIASVSAQFITAFVQMLLAVYILRFRINYRYIAALTIFLLVVMGAFYYTKGLGSDWYVGMAAGLLISILAAFILKLLNISELFRIIKSREAN
ncbi:MAG: oligosaccharide flippase family protein [Bacteroidota bacterium]|nr:oligosaccharide flippase family protein [Bacteroidota bacterium]